MHTILRSMSALFFACGFWGLAGCSSTGSFDGAPANKTPRADSGSPHGGTAFPAITDPTMNGSFPTNSPQGQAEGPDCEIHRPATLGENGFKHPPTMWGNGITTTPAAYVGLLGTIASNGFVIVASNSTNVTAPLMTAGLDWLVAQNDVPGDFQGKLDPSCLVSIGYSLGGGASVNAGSHENVVTTVSFHGLTGNSAALHGPLLLFTSTMDTFVSAAQFVTPTFDASTVQTFYATLSGTGDAGHYTPINTGGPERAPAIAWLRLWVYGDQAARQYFDGADCILCKDPWTNPQTKNWQ